MSESTPTKPLIFADDPFDSMDEALAYQTGDWDLAYVPGYSDVARQNQHRVRNGEPEVPLPKFVWVRISTGKGDVSGTDPVMMTWRRKGYMACGTEKLKELSEEYWPEYGYNFPPQAHVAPDGTIRRHGDVALFYVMPDRYQKNKAALQKAVQNQQVTRELEPETEGLELYQDSRQEKRRTNPGEVLTAS